MSSKLCRCGRIVPDRCDRCNKQELKRNTTSVGYGHDHRKASERWRRTHPMCERCVMEYGVLDASPATSMHHIEAIKDAPNKRMDPQNWLAVCEPCHELLEGNTIDGLRVKRWSEEHYYREMG